MAALKVRPLHVVLGVVGGLVVGGLYWAVLSDWPARRPGSQVPLAASVDFTHVRVPQADIDWVRRAVGPDSLLALHINRYREQIGRYPRELREIVAPDETSGESGGWRGPYLNNPDLLRDPWGQVYQYAVPGDHNPQDYDLWSIGADGVNGTTDDIGNW
ncbi:MAG: type II secretion system protein GspG [Phycisphaerales bacterium]|nr:MAG: type II secretion system protein GspG [Phycisphaerales bacterium]